MWHKFSKSSPGAVSHAAPLLIKGIVLRNQFQGMGIMKELVGILDTGASRTVIPLEVALEMQLPSAGRLDDLQSFDRRIVLGTYSLFQAEMFIPQWGWLILPVVGCDRDTVLLGRDICGKKLLLANWHSCGFGMRSAEVWHRPLELLFKRIRKKKMFTNR